MADYDSKKFYWLKLNKDFFQQHDIRVIKSMPNGKDYLLFYLQLLCEATSHEGNLRFSDTVPYNEQMLSVITDTNIDIVRNAVQLFQSLGMMTILDDGTIYIEEVNKMLGSETGAAKRQREYRNKNNKIEYNSNKLKSVTMSQPCHNLSQNCHREIEIEKELEIELELEKDINTYAPSDLKKLSEQPAISLTLNDKTQYPITQKEINEWKELYPAVDILQELRNMKGWLNANPTKRKTKSGIKRFINSWLAREQNSGYTRKKSQQISETNTNNIFAKMLVEETIKDMKEGKTDEQERSP